MYCIVQVSIPSDEVKINEWLLKEDDVVEFLMNEYHSALGAENIKSKFFHLNIFYRAGKRKYIPL